MNSPVNNGYSSAGWPEGKDAILDGSRAEVVARYWIETAHPLEQAAEAMAGEQSSGTFVALEAETPELRARHAARVIRITPLGTVPQASLPGSRPPRGGPRPIEAAEVELGFPVENCGHSLCELFTMVAGNLFELGPFSGLRLLDLEVPAAFADSQPGPQFGIEGTRALCGVRDRPILGTIIKPSVGLSPAATASLVDALCRAGLDFIKDDELIANPPYSPVAERIRAVMPVIERHAQRTGRKVLYACNITAPLEEMKRHHDSVLEAGGNCVMINLLSAGLTALQSLRRLSALPIHGHRAGWGMFSRCPALGMGSVPFQKIMRMAGADHLHVNGIRNKFCESDASVIASARACQTPIHGRHTALPVFSSGQTVLQAADTYAALGNTDLMFLAGGGVMAHPDGPEAGVQALRLAWQAATEGTPLPKMASAHPVLARAVGRFQS